MNIEGNNPESGLDNGGEIDGDLIITGDLTGSDAVFDNLVVNETATINTLITNQELKIEDPLIELGINNPADLLNLGIIEHFNNGVNDRYSGLIRDRTTKKQYLFENSLTLPTTTTDMTTLQKGDLVINNLESNNLKIISSSNEFLDFVDNGDISNTWSIGRDLNLTDSLEVVYDKQGSPSIPLIINENGIVGKNININFQYSLPQTDGTLGQIIKTDGAGNLSFSDEAAGGGTLQDAFDASTEPQITTDITNDTLVLRQGISIPAPVLEIQDSSSQAQIKLQPDGGIECNSINVDPVTGVAFATVRGNGINDAALLVGNVTNASSTIANTGVISSIGINSTGLGELTLSNSSDTFKLKQISTNPGVLTLEKDTVQRVSFEDTETRFGPDSKIILRDTGQVRCQRLDIIPDVGDAVFACAPPPGANVTWSSGAFTNNQASMFLTSNNRSLIQMNSNTANLIKFTPGGSATAKTFCIEQREALNNLIFAYDPSGGPNRREPLKIESELVTATKLNINGAFTLPDVDGISGQVLQTDGSGGVTWESLPESSYGEQSFSGNGTATPIPVQNQWEDVAGTRVAGSLKDFTAQATTLTYTGTETKTFKYSFQCTAEHTGGGVENYEIGVFKNGVLDGGIMNVSLDDNAAYPRSTSTSIIIELATNDTITTKVRCTTDDQNVLFFAIMSNVISVTSGTGGGGGGGGTLQDAYDLSTTPEITTDTGQGLTLRSGGPSAFEEVLKIQTSSGTQTASISASGIATFNILNVTGQSILEGGVKIGNALATSDYDLPSNNVGATDGDILKYDLASRQLQFFKPFGYARDTPAVISNNALELALTDTGNPDLVIPGGTLKVGDAYRITSTGQFRNGGILDNATFRVRMAPLGPVVAQILFGAVAIGSPQYYKLEVLLTARTVGGSASFAQTISFFVNNQTIGTSTAPVGTFNSLVDQPFAVSAQWSNIGVNNILTQQQLTIEKIK